MAFQGDFEKVDESIKVQLKALVQNDYETIRKLQNSEMSNDDIKYYMADIKLKRQLDMERADKEESDYDTDMNRSMFQEFWGDLSEFKKKPAADGPGAPGKGKGPFHQKSKSVSRSGHMEQSKSSNTMKGAAGIAQRGLQTPVPPQRGHSGIQLPSLAVGSKAQKMNNFLDDMKQNPEQMLLKTINDTYIRPKMKFDNVMEEYMAKQMEFDALRSGLNKVSQDSLKQEMEVLKTKMEVLKKTQAIELKHTRLVAAREADTLLKTKLGQAKVAYEGEFEHLCQQYEALRSDNKQLKEDKIVLKRRITQLELIITQQNNLIETTGYKIRKKDSDENPNGEQARQLVAYDEMENAEEVPKKVQKFIENGRLILRQNFNFYTFALELN